mgnify:FL=1
MTGIFTRLLNIEFKFYNLVNAIIKKPDNVQLIRVPAYWTMESIGKESLENKFGM